MKFGVEKHEEIRSIGKGRRVGVMANYAVVDSNGSPSFERLCEIVSPKVVLTVEHGLSAALKEGSADNRGAISGIAFESIYGKGEWTNPDKLDLIVYDLPDIGVRYYTHLYHLYKVMKSGIDIVILDRPPLVGLRVEGNVPEPRFLGDTVCTVPGPVLYGLTPGESARLLRDYYGLNGNVVVLEMDDFSRTKTSGFVYRKPSPAIISPEQAYLYSGTCLFEATNWDEARGTSKPFVRIGCPPECVIPPSIWEELPILHPCRYYSPRLGALLEGIDFSEVLHSEQTPLQVVFRTIGILLRDQEGFVLGTFLDRLLGSDIFRRMFEQGEDPGEIYRKFAESGEGFRKIMTGYFLYE